MKAISAVIVVVLILLITVGIAMLAYTFASDTFDTVSESGTRQTDAVSDSMLDDIQDTLYAACGDGECNGDENCNTCPTDCHTCCGNGKVDFGETCEVGTTTDCGELGGYESGTSVDCLSDCPGYVNNICIPLPGCEDEDSDSYMGTTEACSEGTDCDDDNENIWKMGDVYFDSDFDGYGGTLENNCIGDALETGYHLENTDCDDTDYDINPDANEVCDDTIDNNCDDDIDCDDSDCSSDPDCITFSSWSSIFVSTAGGDKVLEIDQSGNSIWQFDIGLDYPFDVERLSNGNTLIADKENERVIEINTAGTIVWEVSSMLVEFNAPYSADPYDADRLDNGNTLISGGGSSPSGYVIEVNPAGTIVGVFWYIRLPN